jgi:signal recognition particle receptor subunit beta
MAARWGVYIVDCHALIFVVDCSDLGALTSAVALLHETLANREYLRSRQIVIALNKSDLCDAATLSAVENALVSDDIVQSLRRGKGSLWVVKGNCRNDSLANRVLDFLSFVII